MPAKQALGRGLKALIPDTPQAREGMAEISIDRLRPNPHQPRHRFDEDGLAELAASIGRHGVQWMTAGSGIVHSEMPAEELLDFGGRMHDFQL